MPIFHGRPPPPLTKKQQIKKVIKSKNLWKITDTVQYTLMGLRSVSRIAPIGSKYSHNMRAMHYHGNYFGERKLRWF